jgi:hypothetical protein
MWLSRRRLRKWFRHWIPGLRGISAELQGVLHSYKREAANVREFKKYRTDDVGAEQELLPPVSGGFLAVMRIVYGPVLGFCRHRVRLPGHEGNQRRLGKYERLLPTFNINKNIGVFAGVGKVGASDAGSVNNSFAWLVGGGFTILLTRWVSFQTIPVEYVMNTPNGNVGNDFLARAGIAVTIPK